MSPTGSDSNNGLTPGTAWLTPNHAVQCGDVILAAAGTYTSQFTSWTAPSNCPSTSGGIDGNGGIYFATVLCATAFGCTDTQSSGSVFRVNANNWAIEGWVATATAGFAYLADATATGTTIIHHVAFINDIAQNSDDGFTTGDGGKNHNVPGNGVDQFAVVGSLAYNSNNDPICVAAVDDPGPANFDSSSGTHVFWAGVFAINNSFTCPASDGEGLMWDTFDAHGYTGQAVLEQSIITHSARYGMNIFYQGFNTGNAPMFIFGNTFAADFESTTTSTDSGAAGEINIQSTGASLPYPIAIYNNIAKTNWATAGGVAGHVNLFCSNAGGTYNITYGATGIENICKGSAGVCPGGHCDGGDNINSYGNSIGTNIYVDPLYKSISDLLNNHMSAAPNCTGFTSVTACMGWTGSSVTSLSIIDDLTATATQAAGKGYQTPGACVADSYYPTWLKGMVYLAWNAATSTITEQTGLITKPCGI